MESPRSRFIFENTYRQFIVFSAKSVELHGHRDQPAYTTYTYCLTSRIVILASKSVWDLMLHSMTLASKNFKKILITLTGLVLDPYLVTLLLGSPRHGFNCEKKASQLNRKQKR